MKPVLSVVISSLNGAARVGRCLHALYGQTIQERLQVIVVDDGSTDSTGAVARAGGATVLRHEKNRGVSAARNSGVKAATAPIVAFLDDDCEPHPEWAEKLIGSYDPDVVALGGPITPQPSPGILLDYLARNNPHDPLELELAWRNDVTYRFLQYIRHQWIPVEHHGRREVFAIAAANMSVRREAFLDIGGFDENIHFGSEDYDLCWRLKRAFPSMFLIFEPAALVIHHFTPSLLDTMRRSRVYGRGSALMYRKWPNVGPTFFPYPTLVLASLVLSANFPPLIVVAALLPHLFYPRAFCRALADRRMQHLVDPYLQLIQEACDNWGFVEGLWRYRRFPPDPSLPTVSAGVGASSGNTGYRKI